ncbi:MAG: PEP-CTERM sorting domain-containing protein [Pirellulaceae bacterium]
MQARINEIHYDTDSVPEPASSMTLLCMGAAGLAGYRRRRKS